MATVEQAIIRTGGKQYRVGLGRSIKIEKLELPIGSKVVFEDVLLTGQGAEVRVGTPRVEGARVEGTVTHQGRHKKVIVYKFRRRKNYRKRAGHRQSFTEVKVETITT